MEKKTKVTTQGISFPAPLLRAAKIKASADRRSLSGYVQALIDRDIGGKKKARAAA